jgi:hypothetical protein
MPRTPHLAAPAGAVAPVVGIAGAAGVLVMVLASLWAPPQPELIGAGGACQVAPCGTLEDPDRWRAAWWLWTAGCAAPVVAVLLRSPPVPRPRPLQLVLGLVAAVVWVAVAGLVAVLVALLTSVQGAATVVACCLLGPALALGAGLVRGRGRGRVASC